MMGVFRDGEIMPKENINCVAMPQLRAEVGWKADAGEGAGYVQVATVHTDSPAIMPAAPEGPDDRNLAPEKLDGWHVTLDREQINRLIRSLRRARDSAFGADA